MPLSETATILYEQHGSLTLDTQQLSKVLHYKTTRVLLNAISSGSCPVHTFKAGKYRVADVRDVADYLDKVRAR